MMQTARTTNPKRRAEAPDRLDLDARTPLIRPIWRETAAEALHLLVTGRPSVPPGARLAPTPAGADPILGHLRLGRGEPLTYFPRWRAEVGDVARLRLAGVTAHLLGHPRLARYVLQEANESAA